MRETKLIWMKQVPNKWEKLKLKDYYEFEKGKNAAVYTKEYISENEGEFPVYSGQTENDGVMGNINTFDYDIEECLFTTTVGAKVMTPKILKGKFSLSQNCLIMKNKKIINNLFMYYMLLTMFDYEKSMIPAYMQPSLRVEDLQKYIFYAPGFKEQNRIAKYLDKKVIEIDNVIQKTKETIEDYKKYKESKITEIALTGLRKKNLKETKIDWIGKIPNDWKIESFRNVMFERNEKNNPIKTEERLSLSIDKGVTLYADKTTNLDRFKEDYSQYKLVYKGDLVFNSMNMIVGATGYSKYFGCTSPVYYTFYDKSENHITSKYFEYVFKTKTVKKVLYSMGKGIMSIDRGDDKINTCRLKISRDDLRTFKVPVPSIEEQNEIVKYLENKCIEIDNLISSKQKIIDELELYKKTIIYEYVTGKKEVN